MLWMIFNLRTKRTKRTKKKKKESAALITVENQLKIQFGKGTTSMFTIVPEFSTAFKIYSLYLWIYMTNSELYISVVNCILVAKSPKKPYSLS